MPAVVAWASGPMAEIFGDSLDDPRVTIREADVGVLIRQAASRYDAILLDVDNGPEGLSRQENDGLYDATGLAAAHAALRDGGVLAVWSSAPDADFTRRLREAGFVPDEVKVRANGTRGARHIIWIATARQTLPGAAGIAPIQAAAVVPVDRIWAKPKADELATVVRRKS